MVDWTSVLTADDETGYDLINAVALITSIFTTLGLAFFGIQQASVTLFAVGIGFLVLPIIGAVLSDNAFLKSPASPGEVSLSFWTGMLLVLISRVFTGQSFSFLALPTESYLSFLSGAPIAVQDIINNFAAPTGENYALIGIAILLALALDNEGGGFFENNIARSVVAAAVTVGAGFGFLHGVRSTSFFLFAFVFMALMVYVLLGTDAGIVSVRWLPVTMLFTIGLHAGINIGNSGGLLDFYSTILAAQEPVIVASVAILLFHGLTALLAIGQVVEYVFGA